MGAWRGGLLAVGVLAAIVLGATARESADGGSTGGTATARPPEPLPPSRGRTFHVSSGGKDANPGTRERPWRSVQRALDTLRPGERALVHAGTYVQDLVAERAGTPRAPITIAAWPGERVVLRAASTTGDTYPLRITSGAAWLRVRGFVIERARGISSTNVYFEGLAHDIELSDNEIRFSQDQGVFSERTTRRLRIVRNRVHANGLGHQPGQHQSHGIYLEGTGHYVASNAVYDHPFGFGIQVYPANRGSVIVNNTVVGSAHSGIVVGGDDGVSNIVIRNNILAFNGRYGVQMDSTCPDGPVVVDTNVIFGNPDGPIEKGCGSLDASRGNIYADPQLRDVASGDFRTGTESPARDRARADFAPPDDLAGHRRAPAPDIGALEGTR